MSTSNNDARPLAGLCVLEMGQLLAAPFAGMMLGYFGAEVIKIEPPGGDAIRTWRGMENGTSLWFRSLGRNKRSVVIDLRTEEGRTLARKLAVKSDVLLENFRPGTMEAWGLGPDDLFAEAPGLVYARVSGFGQTGPYRSRPGFASVCEAMAGLRHLTGNEGEPPVRTNLSLGDTVGGLHAMIGVLLALEERRRSGKGQVVDVALTESVLNLLESTLPEAERLGVVRGPSGSGITGIAPSNAYACACGRLVVIGANTTKLFQALMSVAGRPDLAEDPSLADNPGRVARAAEIDAAIGAWARGLTAAEATSALVEAGVPVGPVYDARAILDDPHFRARGVIERADDDGTVVTKVAPVLGRTPGRTDWVGPDAGAHTAEVLRDRLALTPEVIAALRARGVIG